MNEELHQQNQDLKDQIAILTQQLDWPKRQLFGRKSEQLKHPDLFAVQPRIRSWTSDDERDWVMWRLAWRSGLVQIEAMEGICPSLDSTAAQFDSTTIPATDRLASGSS